MNLTIEPSSILSESLLCLCMFIPLDFAGYDEADMINRAASSYIEMRSCRTVQDFSDKAVPKMIIDHCLLTAGTSVSGLICNLVSLL